MEPKNISIILVINQNDLIKIIEIIKNNGRSLLIPLIKDIKLI